MLLDMEFLVDKVIFFYFSTLKMLLFCLLASVISENIPAIFHVVVPLYTICFYYAFKIVSSSSSVAICL